MPEESITPPEDKTILSCYPVFEKDQVLTKEHLNGLTAFLEQQDRITRSCLTGSGIICGLEVEYNGSDTIKILKGSAVTSMGYVMIRNSELNFSKYRKYEDKAGYTKFLNAENKQVDLWELSSETNNTTALSSSFLSDKCLIMYHESVEINIEECTEKKCDEQGRIREYNIKYILISRDNLEDIIKSCYNKKNITHNQLEIIINAKYYLSEINLKRFGVDNSNLITQKDITDEYDKIIKGNISTLSGNLTEALSIVKSICPSIDGSINAVRNKLDTKFKTASDSKEHYQYVYDFLYDLKLGYDELKEKAMLYINYECCTSECFPHHIMLADITNMFTCPRSIYRHRFYPSNGNVAVNYKRELKSLFNRLIILINSFSLNSGSDGIKITPSKNSDSVLSDRAIPFYYSLTDNLLKEWNFYLSHYCKKDYNLSYNSSRYQTNITLDSIINPLNYEIESYDFFRIEGHINKQLSSALKEIEEIRNNKRLPFDVIALKLGTDENEIEVDRDCRFTDIETTYATLRGELLCTLSKLKSVFYNLRLDLNKYIEPTSDGDTEHEVHEEFSVDTGRMEKSKQKLFVMGSSHGTRSTPPLTSADTTQPFLMKDMIEEIGVNVTGFNIQNRIVDFLQLKGLTEGMKMNTYETYFYYPALMYYKVSDLTKCMPEDFSEFDYDEFSENYSALLAEVPRYKERINLSAGKGQETNPEISYAIDKLYYDCTQEKFKAISDIYSKRTIQLQKQFLFSNYIKNNPAIEHKSGVSKGGTFILVYNETVEDAKTMFDIFKDKYQNFGTYFNLNEMGNISLLKNKMERHLIEGKIEMKTAGALQFPNALPDESGIKSRTTGNNMKDEELLTTKIPQLTMQKKYFDKTISQQRKRRTIVADFFVPYICCSDCPPVQYIFEQQKIIFDITPKEYCTESSDIPFTVSPVGGDISPAEYIKKIGSLYYFIPSKVSFTSESEIYKDIKFVYTSLDGNTANTSVKVYRKTVALIGEISKDQGNQEVSVTFNNSSKYAETYKWEFSDGKTSTEITPTFVFQYEEKERDISIKLTASNPKCSATAEGVLYITAKTVATLVSDKTEMCNLGIDPKNSETPHYFTVNLPDGILKVDDDRNSILINEADKFGFYPSKIYFGNQTSKTLKFIYNVNNTDSEPLLITVYKKPTEQSFKIEGSRDDKNRRVKIEMSVEKISNFSYRYEAVNKELKVLKSYEGNIVNLDLAEKEFLSLVNNMDYLRLIIENKICVTAVYKNRSELFEIFKTFLTQK